MSERDSSCSSGARTSITDSYWLSLHPSSSRVSIIQGSGFSPHLHRLSVRRARARAPAGSTSLAKKPSSMRVDAAYPGVTMSAVLQSLSVAAAGLLLVSVSGCSDDSGLGPADGSGATTGTGGTGGGGDPGTAGATPVGCEWFAGPNCWRTAVEEANACTDENGEGTFNAGRSACSYDDGTEIAFTNSVPDDGYPEGGWHFTITRNGATCAEFEDLGPTGDDGSILESESGELRLEVVGVAVVITCHDGARVSIDGEALDECVDGRPGIGMGGSTGPGSVLSMSFSLSGGDSDENLWSCADPE